jgi:hypothetical protein
MTTGKPTQYATIERGSRFAVRAALALITLVVAACAATTLTNSWKSPDYKGPALKKLLVVGVSKQSVTRRTFEDGFVEQLKAAGVDAVASYTLIPQDGQATEAELTKAVKDAGADGTLITHLVRIDKTIQYTPTAPIGMGYYGGYAGAWGGYYDPAMVSQTDTVVVETSLFGVDESQLLWSGTSQTFAPTSMKENLPGFAKVIIGALKKEKLI